MKKLLKHLAIIAIGISLTTTCIIHSAEEDMDPGVKSYATGSSGYLQVLLKNSAPNTLLAIDSIRLFNTLEGELAIAVPPEGILLLNGEKSATRETALPPQRFTLWTPDELPQQTSSTYLQIHGNIYCINPDSTLLLLSCYPMYTGITGDIAAGHSTSTTVDLHSNAPIYIEQNGAMIKVLQEIGFSPTVSGWEEDD